MATYFIQNTNSVEDIEQMKNVIDKVNKVNTTATSNIGQLTDLNNKAQELSNNIQQALPINTELKENIKIGQPLVQEAIEKNTELQASLEKTKEFIDGLDGSQNIPQIRLDVTELQNGLKSNQALSYEGSSIAANNTLEGRTEGMRIGGRTLVNLKGNVKNRVSTWVDNDDKYTLNLESGHGQPSILYNLTHVLKENQKYTVIVNLVEYTSGVLHFSFMNSEGNKLASTTELVAESKGLKKFVFTTNSTINAETLRILPRNGINNIYSISKNILILEGDWTNKDVPSYFEGIESFGEQEGNKISILSNSENLVDTNNSELWQLNKGLWSHGNGENPNVNGGMITDYIDISYIKNVTLFLKGRTSNYFFCCYDENKKALMNLNKQYLKPSNAKFIRFFVLVNENNTPLTRFENPYLMLSYDTFKDYKPYKQDKKDILIKEPLRSVGGIQDVVYEDNGQVKIDKYVKQYTFTGDETITIYDDKQTDTICFRYYDSNQISSWEDTNKLICNSLKTIGSAIYQSNVEGCSSDKFAFLFRIAKSKLSTLDANGFKAWLKANPTTIVYQLAEPVVEVCLLYTSDAADELLTV